MFSLSKFKSKNKNRKSAKNKSGYKFNTYYKTPFSMSSSIMRYGPGRNISIINSVHDLTANTVTRFPLQTLLLTNTEFNTKKTFFRYFKILEIRLCLFPSGVPSTSYIYANLSWNAIQYEPNDLRQDDTTKIAPAYRTRNKIFRWLPIRGVINVNSTSQEVPTNFLDVSQFISTDRIVTLPGWLYISNVSDSVNACNIEIKVEFRANDYGVQNKKLIDEKEMFEIKTKTIPTMKEENEEEKILEEEEDKKEIEEKKIIKKKIKK